MSRTYRKSGYTAYYENSWYIDQIESGIDNYTARLLSEKELTDLNIQLRRNMWRGRTDNKWRSSLPHYFRNMVNKSRRARDRQELWKAINLKDHEEQCSKWNCKDNNAWGYW